MYFLGHFWSWLDLMGLGKSYRKLYLAKDSNLKCLLLGHNLGVRETLCNFITIYLWFWILQSELKDKGFNLHSCTLWKSRLTNHINDF